MKLPKLNLRDLFWLVIVVALGLVWWQDRRANVDLTAENTYLTDTLVRCELRFQQLLQQQTFLRDRLGDDARKELDRVQLDYDRWSLTQEHQENEDSTRAMKDLVRKNAVNARPAN